MKNATVRLFGNIGKEPECQYTPQGKLVLKTSLAVNHGSGDYKTTNWYNLVAWEKTAEWMNKACEKGTQVYIEGTLLLREWADKEGVKHISPDVTVSDWRVISRGKKEKEADENEPEFMQD